jgi:hypothetical protein
MEGFAAMNLAESLLVLGQRESVEALVDLGERTGEEIGRAFLSAWTGLVRARLAGGFEGAEQHHRKALEIARESAIRVLQAAVLSERGRSRATSGVEDEAAADLAEAESIAREMNLPNPLALAVAVAATLPGGDPAAAAKTLDDLGEKPWVQHRMEARWYLWQATQDAAHLEESKRLLDHLVEHAPEEYKTSMIENVPLHKSIRDANA